MENNDLEPKKMHILKDDSQIKAYTHPTRILLLHMLAKEKRTISSIAKELGVHPANITHHFKLLEKTGLIALVEKKDTGKNLEKYYRSVAHAFEMNPDTSGIRSKKTVALSILKNDLSAAINSIKEDDERKMTALLSSVKLSGKNAGRFIKKLENLVRDFQAAGSKDGCIYNLNVSIYPNDVDYPENNDPVKSGKLKL
jgi:DNA-binding transcriptional ArsR family regulator